MDPARLARVKDLFWKASEVAPELRGPLLDRECGGETDLRREVESLLAAHGAPGGPLDLTAPRPEARGGPTDGAAPDPDRPVTASLPERVGSYKLLGLLGEGGMGVVYRAEQANPRRTVALKLLRPGLATPRMLRRFELEAQVLGRLQHPGIAQIFEAGTVEERGCMDVYFAMELVEGADLVAHADSSRLGRRNRLELFARVCDAVQYAHQRGVIHRDLKPANILVDAAGQPKVLDFGVARTTDADVRLTTLADGRGGIVGTLHYMSPEQVSGEDLEIDTRSDVYALGVIAYELLSGRLPFDFTGQRITEALRRIAEEPPPPLSSVQRDLAGDLEAIVHKALEKDKARRYGSAAELAEDVRRFLRREPVAARRPTLAYRLRRFVQRNRVLTGGLAAVFLALAAGGAATAWQAIRAERARAAAQRTADRQEKVLAFLKGRLLTRPDAFAGGSRDVTFVEVLDAIVREKEAIFPDDPEVRAEVLSTIAESYRGLSRLVEAERFLEESLAILRGLFGEADARTLAALNDLGLVLEEQGRAAEARDALAEALAKSRSVLGPEHPQTLSAANNLALALKALGDHAGARRLLEDTVEARRRLLGEAHRDTLTAMGNLAQLYADHGPVAKAKPLFRRVLASHERTLGPDHPETLISASMLSAHLQLLGELAEAEDLRRRCHAALVRVLGEKHDDTIASWFHLAKLLHQRGKLDEAVEELRAALQRMREVHREDNVHTTYLLSQIGLALLDAGKLDEAEAPLRESLETRRRLLGEGHPDALFAEYSLAQLELKRGRLEAAESGLRRVLERAGAALPEDDWRAARMRVDLGLCLTGLARYPEAEAALRRALSGLEAAFGPENPHCRAALEGLQRLYEAWGRPAEAAAVEAKLQAAGSPASPAP
ncbi:MAG: serine/threonine protein kinase [Planctomycetes bacterium]|nr:serine/threonine protein kinase [Planctomycetota bacterium]